jgi:hypothetical protein
VEWAQEVLGHIERSRKGPGKRPPLKTRIEGLLQGIARRLVKDRRSRDRKTRHARQRQEQGDRPTHMALADLSRAALEDVFFDRRQKTLVVLGERGRAHVFNPQGKLVTSLRTHPGAVTRRQRREHWRPAEAAELEALRAGVDAATQDSDSSSDEAPAGQGVAPQD